MIVGFQQSFVDTNGIRLSVYRGYVTLYRALDDLDNASTVKVKSPLWLLLSDEGLSEKLGGAAAYWQNCLEENPTAVLDAFIPFFNEGQSDE